MCYVLLEEKQAGFLHIYVFIVFLIFLVTCDLHASCLWPGPTFRRVAGRGSVLHVAYYYYYSVLAPKLTI
jgi:hypothetical protein